MKIKNSLYSKLEIALIFGFFGLVFTVVSAFLGINDYVKRNAWIESEGYISVVNHSAERKEFTYSYNGVTYNVKSNSYSSFDDVGDLIIIYINPNNPSEVYEANTSLVFIIFLIIGSPFLIVGIIFLIKHLKFMKIRKICLNEGSPKRVKVLRFEETKFHYNRRPYYVMIVNYQGNEYKSSMFLLPYKSDIYATGAIVDFYYINEDTYYIDLDTFRYKNIDEEI